MTFSVPSVKNFSHCTSTPLQNHSALTYRHMLLNGHRGEAVGHGPQVQSLQRQSVRANGTRCSELGMGFEHVAPRLQQRRGKNQTEKQLARNCVKTIALANQS